MKSIFKPRPAHLSLGAVFLLFFPNAKAQHSHDSTTEGKGKFFQFHFAEFEVSYAPKQKEFLSNASGRLDLGYGRVVMPYFFEYNFTTKGVDYSTSAEFKLNKYFYVGGTMENDFFGEQPRTNHFQLTAKSYLQNYSPFGKYFHNAYVGVNRSMMGTALHRVGGYELTYGFLTHPIWVTENIGLVFSSMGRIRENHDLHIVQAGIENKKWHSIFMLGTGHVYDGITEVFVGVQYSLVQDHKKFSLK